MSGGRIPREFIDELLVRVDLVDLIDSRVPLKKTGNNYVARCPFHNEKTPSFSVNRNKQFFHCFGCGASGNAISFLMDFNHLDFVEAVEDLAAIVGVAVPRQSADYYAEAKKDDLNSLYLLMEQVAAFYVNQLRIGAEGKKAVEYLKARGVDGACASNFMLGYAPNEWKALASQFDQTALMAAGLLVSNDNGQIYDRFRGRIMFPIRDKRARIIGFGGRVLDDTLPKYLNSPETSLFHKGKEVYGLYELLAKDSKPSRILLVEGYMDVIALAQFGLHYAVAALGTATSQAHLDLLFRFSSELVLCFDGDKAGREAAWRAMDVVFPCLKEGRQVRIMILPQTQDPDSLMREEGLDRFTERVLTAATLSEYFFAQCSKKLNLTELEGRAQLINKARPYLDKLPEGIFKDMMFEQLKALSNSVVLDILQNKTRLATTTVNKRQRQENRRLSSAREAIALLIQHPNLAEVIKQKEIDVNSLSFAGSDLFISLLQAIYASQKPVKTAILVELYRDTAEEKTVNALATLVFPIADDMIDAVFFDALNVLLKQSWDTKLDLLLSKNERTPQENEELRQILAKKNRLIQNNKIF